MALDLKHIEKDLLPLYNKECSVEYEYHHVLVVSLSTIS